MSEQPPQLENQGEVLTDSIKSTIDFVQYVESHNFGDYKKYALDLASLLNSPDLEVNGDESKADTRTTVFNRFCTACAKAGVETPPLEEGLFMPFVPEDYNSGDIKPKTKQVLKIKNDVESQTREMEDVNAKKEIDTLTEFMLLFAEKFDLQDSFDGISSREIVALLNKKLTEKGMKPARPDYLKLEFKTRAKEQAPSKPIKLLIVDDNFEEIVNSYLGAAGWPDVTIEYLRCERDYSDKSSNEKKISNLIEKILATSADVILMDQGIGDGINGSDILKSMNIDPRAAKIKKVANTGGNDDDLRAQGAFRNFEKGRGRVDGLRSAIKSI